MTFVTSYYNYILRHFPLNQHNNYTQILILCHYQYDGSEYKISSTKLEYLYSDTQITQSSEYNIS